MPEFGWLPSTPEMQAQNDRYPMRLLGAAPATVEYIFDYPANLVSWYDQGNVGACVGYSCSWQMSIYNWTKKYNASWLYRQAKIDDGDPSTDPNRDTGAYLWAGQKVLQKRGHCVDKTTTPVLDEGIENYYWARSIDDIRTAFSLPRPAVFGLPWYSGFMSPVKYQNEWWIGRSSWGRVVGGHAICCIGCSDTRQAVMLLNSWGADYPPVWIGYSSITRLLSENGECAVGVDRGASPPPPPPPADKITVTLNVNGVDYGPGELARV